MNLGLEYIKYQWKAKRRHGVHSPFIYDLTDKCFRTPVSMELTKKLSLIRSKLRSDTRTIEITDFGAGSKKLGNTRSITSIYNTSSSKGKYGTMLFQLVRHYSPKNVLELGTSMGIGTLCMADGNESTLITTVEGCPNTYSIAKENFNELGLENVVPVNAQFSEFIGSLNDELYDLVFIDGHHDGEALKKYMEQLDPFTHENTLFVLDDIRWSDSMFEAWESIESDSRYHVTIDLFRMGIVLKRPEQVKEHFVIR